jgi:hypothetical protein
MSKSHSMRPNPKCSRCGEPATIFQDDTNYCDLHYRYRQMRHGAQRGEKAIPSFELLDQLFQELRLESWKCPACKRTMNLLMKDGHASMVTLQHDRGGAIRLICFSCNSRHQHHPGDTYYELPEGHKRCHVCEKIKPLEEFYTRMSPCKTCQREKAKSYFHANKEARNAYKKRYVKANRAAISEYERLRRLRKKGVSN